jgi:hypothetical protein
VKAAWVQSREYHSSLSGWLPLMEEELLEKQMRHAEGEQLLHKVVDTRLHRIVVEVVRILVVDSLAVVLVGIQQEHTSR